MDLPVGPDNNMALLRFAIIGELDAVNLYEQIIKTTSTTTTTNPAKVSAPKTKT